MKKKKTYEQMMAQADRMSRAAEWLRMRARAMQTESGKPGGWSENTAKMRETMAKSLREDRARFVAFKRRYGVDLLHPIDAVPFSTRALNAMLNIGIKTIGDMESMDLARLKKEKNVGKKSTAEIVLAMNIFGLKCRDERPLSWVAGWADGLMKG